jgi:hypothetical protein
VFKFTNGKDQFVQSMFFFEFDSAVWSGQFTGTPEDWSSALGVLHSINSSSKTNRIEEAPRQR